jgi:zinc/manganese transport system substrate-binding protein
MPGALSFPSQRLTPRPIAVVSAKALLGLTSLLGLLALAVPCSAGPSGERLPVIASFSILGDLAAEVGGSRVEVSTLVGANGDGHSFQPSPADAGKVSGARVVLVNGLGFEGWMPRLVDASGGSPAVVVVSRGIVPRAMTAEGEHAQVDPHIWQSVANARAMVGNIRDAFAAADPAGRSVYEANAAAYDEKLAALEIEVRATIARIPAERRRIITSHDAFGYFSAAYGVEFVAPQGVSTDAEASAMAVARIIRQIKSQAIPAVFVENISDPRLLARIADETGARIGGTLYSDALSRPEEGAGTYIEMMRHNIRELASALAS